MAKYVMGRDVVEGSSATDVLGKIRLLSRSPGDSNQDYMNETAARVKIQMGKEVRTDSAENFISDLALVGLIKEVPEN